MPRNPTTGEYTRVSNSFSEPILGEVIDPTDADEFFDDLTTALNANPVLIGGTAADSTLTLESTSGVGTTDAIIFKTGSQVEKLRLTSAGVALLSGSTQPTITLSPSSGSTTFGGLYQSGDTLVLTSGGVEDKLRFDLASGGGTTSVVPFTVNPADGSLLALSTDLTGPLSGDQSGSLSPDNGVLNFNHIYVAQAANVGLPTQYAASLGVTMQTVGTNRRGSVAAVYAQTEVSSAQDASVGPGDSIAFVGIAKSNVSYGGTDTGAGARGQLFIHGGTAVLQAGATNWSIVSGGELGVGIATGASARYRLGWSIISQSDIGQQAADLDCALEVSSNNATSFKTSILWSSLHGGPGVHSTGTMLGADSTAFTAANFASFPLLTITSKIFDFPNFSLTGAGNLSATSLTSPLHIGGSGTTGAQLTFQTTTGNGTSDEFVWTGGNNGATQFAKLNASVLQSTSALGVTGTAGAGYLAMAGQSSNPSVAGSNAMRLFADSTGRFSWIRSDGFVRTFASTITADRVYTLPDASGTLLYNGGPLGTPSSGTLTNATGLPISTGLTGAGTGVLTALGVNVGSAGAPVLFNGAGGTPSSLTLTNATGLPIAGGGTGVSSGTLQMISNAVNVDFGVAGDSSITVPLPAGYTRIAVVQVIISGASGNISAATFGVFTASGGGGTAVIAAGTAITITTASDNTNNNMQVTNQASVNTMSITPVSNTLFFRVGATAAQTANVEISYRPIP